MNRFSVTGFFQELPGRLRVLAQEIRLGNSRLAKAGLARNQQDCRQEAVSEIARNARLHRTGTGTGNTSTPDQASTKISVIAWDLGHNPVGRAYLLADVLGRQYDVEVIGANFPRFGRTLWEPLRGSSRVAVKGFPGGNFPRFFRDMQSVAERIDGDVLYVSKPRLPSLELAILAKLHRNRPMILDIDDHELGFFSDKHPLTLKEVIQRQGRVDFRRPYDETWTRFSDTLIEQFDQITVSNAELGSRYGGLIVPHVRDERDFDPGVWPRDAIRNALGFAPDDRVVVFAGTPRQHKGVLEIVAALGRVRRHRCKFLVVGSPVGRRLRYLLRGADPERIVSLPDVPFADLPAYLSAGDLICLPQRVEEAASRYQVPAKLTDALAMGIPVLASPTPPLMPFAEEGLLELLDASLEHKIEAVLDDYPARKRRAQGNRSVFLRKFSYRAALPLLVEVIDRALANPAPFPAAFRDLVEYHRSVFQGNRARPEIRLLERGTRGESCVA